MARARSGFTSWVVALGASACASTSPGGEGIETGASEQGTMDLDASRSPEEVGRGGSGDAIPPSGRLPAGVEPIGYEVALTVVPAQDRFSGRVRIDLVFKEPRRSFHLHAEGLRIARATFTAGGRAIPVTIEPTIQEGVARVSLPAPTGPGEAALELEYDAPFDENNDGLFRVKEDGEWYAFTQFEATLARRVIPSFDEPRFKTPFDVSLTVKSDHVAIANTAAIEETALPGGLKRVRFRKTERLPTYLLALSVGPLDVVSGKDIPPSVVRARPLPLRGAAARGKGARLGYALEKAPALIEWLEGYFGIAYPFDKLDLVAVPGFVGAMENAGMVTFREWHLLIDPASAPIEQLRNYAYIVAHEVAHQWVGNDVTMPWWDDLWLNEAFATWMEYRTVAAFAPEYRSDVIEIEDVLDVMSQDSLISARQIRQPVSTHDDIINAFDDITYLKGAGVLAMFERYLGEDVFRRGVRRYLAAHHLGSATADDFLAALSAESGIDVGASFRTFLLQPGVPEVEVRTSCLNGKAEAWIRQSRYVPLGSKGTGRQVWRIPMCFRVGFASGPKRVCTLATDEEMTISLGTEGCPVWLMPNADGAGYYRFSVPTSEFQSLTRRARDELTVREQLALADSIGAAFASGRLSAAEALELDETFVSSKERSVARMPMGHLVFVKDYLLDAALIPKLEAYVRALYRPVLADLAASGRSKGGHASPAEGEARLFIKDLKEFLASAGNDESLRAHLKRTGEKHLSVWMSGKGADALEADLAELALSVVVQDSDEGMFDRIAETAKRVRDPVMRRTLMRALGSASAPALAPKARALLLDPELRNDDIFFILATHMADARNQKPAWQWLKASFETLRDRISGEYLSQLAAMPAGLCSEEELEDVRGFFGPRIADIPGGPRQLASTMESIELCVAKAKVHRASARAFFTKRREPPRGWSRSSR